MICRYCKNEMSLGMGCKDPVVVFGETSYKRLPATKKCPDCNVNPGGIHHYGCDIEKCPKCGGQLLSCPCWVGE